MRRRGTQFVVGFERILGGSSKLIWSDLRPYIPPQQTTDMVRPVGSTEDEEAPWAS